MPDLIAIEGLTLLIAMFWTLSLRVRPLCLVPMTVLILHVVTLQCWVLVTGLTVGLNVDVWRICMVVVAILLAIGLHLSRRSLARELRLWYRRAVRAAKALGAVRLSLLILLPTAMLSILAVASWFTGNYLGDVFMYHLVPPTEWIVEGRIVFRDWPDPRSYWPMGHGLLTTVWGVTIHTMDSMVLAGLHWVAITLAISWALARQIGASHRVAMLAVLLVMSVPIIWAQAGSGLNDLAACVLALAAVVTVAGRQFGTKLFLLTIAFILIGLGIKPTLLLMAPPIVVVALWRWLRCRDADVQLRRTAWVATMVLLVFVSLFWYAQNAVQQPDHNPLYPASLKLGGVAIWEGHELLAHHGDFSWKSFAGIVAELAYMRGWDAIPLRGGQSLHSTGWGSMVMAVGWAALIGVFLGIRRSRWPVAIFLAMTILLGLGVENDHWFGRFFAYVGPFLAVCVALFTSRMHRGITRILWCFMLVTSAVWGMYVGFMYAAPIGVMQTWIQQ